MELMLLGATQRMTLTSKLRTRAPGRGWTSEAIYCLMSGPEIKSSSQDTVRQWEIAGYNVHQMGCAAPLV